ncbi:hypothetical protein RHGRI_029260 [Rhododendron griersonianum]|uniref:Protein kinase domain-containing protein n=1 Tax=Rhododendron griersonianum TaxID=479676 RepID=A0AAV6IJH3_9ERIC|nr:hypothetical protein RHGRI_029260 [Rhododendron griersonianum]
MQLQVLGTDELNAYLNKYHLELDPQLDALVGRYDVAWCLISMYFSFHSSAGTVESPGPNLFTQIINILCLLRYCYVQAIDFLDKLLRYDQQDRLTAKEAMAHPYFSQVRAAENSRMRTQ